MIKPYEADEPVGRREYERENWGNGRAKHWDDLTEEQRAIWEARAVRERR
jgi:hypothetical protein